MRARLELIVLLGALAVMTAAIPAATSASPARPKATAFAAAAIGSTSAPTPASWVTTTHTLMVGSLDRSYLLVRPRGLSFARLPVYVILHGRYATPALERRRTGFPEAVRAAVFVYPTGYGESWNAGTCCGPAHEDGVDDVAFIRAVVHQVLVENATADPARVFLVGFSNGGRLAFRLACALPTTFRGYAVVGALPVAPCAQRPPLPFIDVSLDHDAFAPLPADATQVAEQRVANRCSPMPTQQTAGQMSVSTWSMCASGDPVAFAVYPGTVHHWPAGGAGSPPAQDVIIAFFEHLPLSPAAHSS